jgi:hypothetical protein
MLTSWANGCRAQRRGDREAERGSAELAQPAKQRAPMQHELTVRFRRWTAGGRTRRGRAENAGKSHEQVERILAHLARVREARRAGACPCQRDCHERRKRFRLAFCPGIVRSVQECIDKSL